MTDTRAFTVTGMSCEHCVRAVHDEVSAVPGVTAVTVDLAAARMTVEGSGLDDALLAEAVAEAGYAAAPAAP
jgi:copper chaperone CopZ